MVIAGGVDTSKVASSGALPTVTFTSGVAKQMNTGRDFYLWMPITYNPTSILAATVKIEISPDNVTYSTISTEIRPALLGLAGLVDSVSIPLRSGYWIRFTATNASLGTASYW